MRTRMESYPLAPVSLPRHPVPWVPSPLTSSATGGIPSLALLLGLHAYPHGELPPHRVTVSPCHPVTLSPPPPAPRPKTNLHCVLSHWNIPYLIIEEGADVFTQPLSSIAYPRILRELRVKPFSLTHLIAAPTPERKTSHAKPSPHAPPTPPIM